VLAIQPTSFLKSNEELAAVGVGTSVSHAKNTSTGMLQAWVELILELGTVICYVSGLIISLFNNDNREHNLPIDGLTTSAGTGRITTLNHEVLLY
jgi:hypothetical protein